MILSFLKPLVFGLLAYTAQGEVPSNSTIHEPLQDVLEYPEDVMAIIDNKCMGCHKPDSRNEKGKKALQWEKLLSLEKADLIATLDEMLEVLEEGSMPPEKMLEKYPDKELTKKETKTLRKWADSTLDDLM
ncbi:MAG: heme-binding domain-containing protein [Cyclobacteriaceae bacterium]